MTRGGLQTWEWIHFFRCCNRINTTKKNFQTTWETLKQQSEIDVRIPIHQKTSKPRIITIFINTWQRHEDSKKIDVNFFFADDGDGNLVLESPLDILYSALVLPAALRSLLIQRTLLFLSLTVARMQFRQQRKLCVYTNFIIGGPGLTGFWPQICVP